MTNEFKVGDRVKALEYTDSQGQFHPEVTGLVVDSVTRHGGKFGMPEYDRLNCYAADLGDRLGRRHSQNEIVQIEAAARFFAHDAPEFDRINHGPFEHPVSEPAAKLTYSNPPYWCCKADFGQHEPDCKNATVKRVGGS